MRSRKEFEENQNIGTAPPTTVNSQRSSPIPRYVGGRPHPPTVQYLLGPKARVVKIAFPIGRKSLAGPLPIVQ